MQVRMLLLVMRPVIESARGGEFDGVHEFDVGTLVDLVGVTSLVIRNEKTGSVRRPSRLAAGHRGR